MIWKARSLLTRSKKKSLRKLIKIPTENIDVDTEENLREYLLMKELKKEIVRHKPIKSYILDKLSLYLGFSR